MKRTLLTLVLIGGAMIGSLYAHHSFAATYQEDKMATIEGRLMQFTFRNPHSFVQVEVKEENGTVKRWSVEWGGAAQLGSQGLSRDSLRPGDHVIVVGQPGRNPQDNRLKMLSIVRPLDGWKWGGTFD
jgi:hypothetical protein